MKCLPLRARISSFKQRARWERRRARKGSMQHVLRISRKIDYGLRAMIYLASISAGVRGALPGDRAADGRPEDFLAKILKTLVDQGLVRSTRGPHGGYALARLADRDQLPRRHRGGRGPGRAERLSRRRGRLRPLDGVHHGLGVAPGPGADARRLPSGEAARARVQAGRRRPDRARPAPDRIAARRRALSAELCRRAPRSRRGAFAPIDGALTLLRGG